MEHLAKTESSPEFVTHTQESVRQTQNNNDRLSVLLFSLSDMHRKVYGHTPTDTPVTSDPILVEETLVSRLRIANEEYTRHLDSLEDLIRGLQEFI